MEGNRDDDEFEALLLALLKRILLEIQAILDPSQDPRLGLAGQVPPDLKSREDFLSEKARLLGCEALAQVISKYEKEMEKYDLTMPGEPPPQDRMTRTLREALRILRAVYSSLGCPPIAT